MSGAASSSKLANVTAKCTVTRNYLPKEKPDGTLLFIRVGPVGANLWHTIPPNGVPFRKSKDFFDCVSGDPCKYKQIVQAIDQGDGWLWVENSCPSWEVLQTQVKADLADGPQQSACPAAEMNWMPAATVAGTPDYYSDEAESYDPEPHSPVQAKPCPASGGVGIAEPMPPQRTMGTLAQGKGKDGKDHEPSDDQHLERKGSLKGKDYKRKDKGTGKDKAKGKKGKNDKGDRSREEDLLSMEAEVSLAAAPASRGRRAQSERRRDVRAEVIEIYREELHRRCRTQAAPAPAVQLQSSFEIYLEMLDRRGRTQAAPTPAALPPSEDWSLGQKALAGTTVVLACAAAGAMAGQMWKGKQDQDDSVKAGPKLTAMAGQMLKGKQDQDDSVKAAHMDYVRNKLSKLKPAQRPMECASSNAASETSSETASRNSTTGSGTNETESETASKKSASNRGTNKTASETASKKSTAINNSKH